MVPKNIPRTTFDQIPGDLPSQLLPKGIDKSLTARHALQWLDALQEDQLAPNATWRDILALTDTLRMFHSPKTVHETFVKLGKAKKRSLVVSTGTAPRLIDVSGVSWLDVDFTFDTDDNGLTGRCAGIVSISANAEGELKIWMIRTWLEHYAGHGNPDIPAELENSVNGITNAVHEYDCIIVGGGQCGLSVAAGCKALGIDYILLDGRPEIGDCWTQRYDSVHWHTPREFGNLPLGRTYPGEPNFMPKDRIGACYKKWAKKHNIISQTGTCVTSAEWDEALQTRTVLTSGHLGKQVWKTKNLVLSIGPGGQRPSIPAFASPDAIKASGFKGTILHSEAYRNAHSWAGKRGVIVGTANTAHDVAMDMVEAGMHTTMIQRGATFVFPGEWLAASTEPDYSLEKATTVADRETCTAPLKVQRDIMNRMLWSMIKTNPERFDALEELGFLLDRYGCYLTRVFDRFGGQCVDQGLSTYIINGDVKIKRESIKALTEKGTLFADSSELEADVIVLATGFSHDFRKDAAQILGPAMAEQMDPFWGLGPDGEIRGYCKPNGSEYDTTLCYARLTFICGLSFVLPRWRGQDGSVYVEIFCSPAAEKQAWATDETVSGGLVNNEERPCEVDQLCTLYHSMGILGHGSETSLSERHAAAAPEPIP